MIVLLTLLCPTVASQACLLGAPFVSQTALWELQNIQNDISLTRELFDNRTAKWAAKHNLTHQYIAYKNLMEHQKLTAEQELDEAVQRLPSLIAELRQIENDNTLTRLMAFQREKALIDRLPLKQQNLLKAAGSIFAPAYQQNKRRPCGPGPFRPGPYGLGLFIPGSGLGQFWQELFGPGSLGPSCGFRIPGPSSVFGPAEIGFGYRPTPPPYGWRF